MEVSARPERLYRRSPSWHQPKIYPIEYEANPLPSSMVCRCVSSVGMLPLNMRGPRMAILLTGYFVEGECTAQSDIFVNQDASNYHECFLGQLDLAVVNLAEVSGPHTGLDCPLTDKE